MNFKAWFEATSPEVALQDISGEQVMANPLMKAAMYIAYRASYDEVVKRDYEEDKQQAIAQGQDPSTIQLATAWSLDNWMYPPGGGTRAPHWNFLGILPTEQDLQAVEAGLQKYNGDIQALADSGEIRFPAVGGITYRDKGESIKLTGLFGWSAQAKGLALAQVSNEANAAGKSIFTGADSHLVDLMDRSAPLFAKLHKRRPDLVKYPTIGLTPPPKDIVPFLYELVSKSPEFSGGGSWAGYNPDGSLNFNLGGSGIRKKFLLGNPVFWRTQIQKVLQRAGVDAKQLGQLKMALRFGAGGIATNMVNKKLAQRGITTPLSPDGIKWVLSQVA